MVSDLNKNFGGSTDLVEKRHGLADLHTPIHPPPNCCMVYHQIFSAYEAKQFKTFFHSKLRADDLKLISN